MNINDENDRVLDLDQANLEKDDWKIFDSLEINQKETNYEFKDEVDRLETSVMNDDWNIVNISDVRQHKLMIAAQEHRNEEDKQTLLYSNLVSVYDNFASTDLMGRFKQLPELAKSILNLFVSFETELTEYADLAEYYSEMVKELLKIKMNGENEFNVSKSNLEVSIGTFKDTFKNLNVGIFKKMIFSLMPFTEKDLVEGDLHDLGLALSKISTG